MLLIERDENILGYLHPQESGVWREVQEQHNIVNAPPPPNKKNIYKRINSFI